MVMTGFGVEMSPCLNEKSESLLADSDYGETFLQKMILLHHEDIVVQWHVGLLCSDSVLCHLTGTNPLADLPCDSSWPLSFVDAL